jgi:O-antigen ligase
VGIYLTPLLQLQRFFVPILIVLLVWAIWRLVFRKDVAVGLALYLGLIIVVDGFYNTGIYLPGLEKGSIRYSEVCAIFLLLHRPPSPTVRTSVTFLVALYFLLLFVSAVRSDSVLHAMFEFRRLVIPQIIAFLVAKRGLGSADEYRRFFLCLMALAILLALFVFWDLFFDRWILYSEMLNKPEYGTNRKQNRFGSLFLNPNLLGAFAILVFPPAFVFALNDKRPWAVFYMFIGLAGLVFALIETKSRGPLLAFAIVLGLLAVGPGGGVSRQRRLRLLAALVAVFALTMPGFYDTAVQRFDSLGNEASMEERSRQTVWNYTVDLILENPLGGIGFGEQEFLDAMDKTNFTERYGEQSLDNPHNSYLQMAVYAGMPALLAFVVANAALLIVAARDTIRNTSSEQRATIFALALGIVGFLASAFPDMHLFTHNVAPVYWVFFGLLLALTGRSNRPDSR